MESPEEIFGQEEMMDIPEEDDEEELEDDEMCDVCQRPLLECKCD